ncbi:AAA family ATPase [Psychrobacter alimentarius]|uniref:AAA family ATPase n=1 Tax=Psychrobacter alimentarius TaxID=261164 RepID=UPI003FD0042C
MLGNDIQIKQLVGVGDVNLSFQPDQRVYCLIGENGIGKTKCLEALFTAYVIYNKAINEVVGDIQIYENKIFQEMITEHGSLKILNKSPDDYLLNSEVIIDDVILDKKITNRLKLNVPIVMVSILSRGYITLNNNIDSKIGSKSERLEEHIWRVYGWLDREPNGQDSLGVDIKEWVVQRAQSANKFQKKEDNRETEITTLLKLLHEVDSQYDPNFLEISGGEGVFIKVANKKTELSELSSGFASILKIIQSIIAGYSYFTNEQDIACVKGVVFIDEIESHLHTKWQATVIPTLKRLFPNTIFYITTHSAIVLSQLQHGEAYELYRDKEDGIVKTELIEHPNNAAFVDLLKDAFDIDINKLKLARDNAPQQKNAKKMLSALLEKRISELKEGTQ